MKLVKAMLIVLFSVAVGAFTVACEPSSGPSGIQPPCNHDLDNGVCLNCNYSEGTEGLEYKLSDDQSYYICTGAGEAMDAERIVLPSTFWGKPVKQLDSLFGARAKVVSLPLSVQKIGAYAFESCTNLENVIITDSVTDIGAKLFHNAGEITFNQYENCRYFGNKNQPYLAFYDVIDKSVEQVSLHASTRAIVPGCLNGVNAVHELTLPSGVRVIPDSCFRQSRLATVTLNADVQKIGAFAFEDSAYLKTVNLSKNLKSIGDFAFNNCALLAGVTFPSELESIGENAFAYCVSLKEIVLPDSLFQIGQRAFLGCAKATTLVTGERLKVIPDSAFSRCVKLEYACLEAVVQIDYYAFMECKSLTVVGMVVPATIESVDENAFFYANANLFLTEGAPQDLFEGIEGNLRLFTSDKWELVEGKPVGR